MRTDRWFIIGIVIMLAATVFIAAVAWPVVLLDVSTPRNRALALWAIDKGVLSVHATFADHGPNSIPLIVHGATWGNAEFVGALLDRGADVNATDSAGQTALNMAIEVGNLETVALLADRGANLDMGADWGHGPLVQAVEKGDVECVQLLVDRGASVAGVSTRAVSAAIRKGNPEILRILIEGAHRELGVTQGADAFKKALEWDLSRGKLKIEPEVVELIRELP